MFSQVDNHYNKRVFSVMDTCHELKRLVTRALLTTIVDLSARLPITSSQFSYFYIYKAPLTTVETTQRRSHAKIPRIEIGSEKGERDTERDAENKAKQREEGREFQREGSDQQD